MEKITLVAALQIGRGRKPIFERLERMSDTFEDGIAAALEHHRSLHGLDADCTVEHRVYRSEGPDGQVHGLVEIIGPSPMVAADLYKIVAGVFGTIEPTQE